MLVVLFFAKASTYIHLVKYYIATKRKFKLHEASGKDPDMSIPHYEKDHGVFRVFSSDVGEI